MTLTINTLVATAEGFECGVTVRHKAGWVRFATLLIPWDNLLRRENVRALLAANETETYLPYVDTEPLF